MRALGLINPITHEATRFDSLAVLKDGRQPSGKRFQVRTAALFRVENGKFTRDLSLFDATGLLTLQDNTREAEAEAN